MGTVLSKMELSSILLLVFLSTAAAGVHVHAELKKSEVQVSWLTTLSMEIKIGSNHNDIIFLTPASNIPGMDTPCLFSGQLEGDPRSVVAVSGCLGAGKTSLRISSRLLPGIVDLSIVDGVSFYVIPEEAIDAENDVVLAPGRIKRQEEYFEFYDEFGDPYFDANGAPIPGKSQVPCKYKVKDALDVAEVPECCNNADILQKYGECCKQLFDGGEEACYQDSAQTTATTYSINWCQSRIRKATDLRSDPVCCLNPFIRDKFKNDQEYRNECCIKFGLCAIEGRRYSPSSICICRLNYCPGKIRGSGWIKNYPDCCWHPVRKYMPQSYPYLYKSECCTQQTECS